MRYSYKNKRIRCNLALLLSSNSDSKDNYLADLKARDINCSSFVSYLEIAQFMFPNQRLTALRHGKIMEELMNIIREKMVQGENILADIPLFDTNERKEFVVSLHNICRENKLRGSFSCIYFKEDNVSTCPDSEELWNDILIKGNDSVRQIVINYNVIY